MSAGCVDLALRVARSPGGLARHFAVVQPFLLNPLPQRRALPSLPDQAQASQLKVGRIYAVEDSTHANSLGRQVLKKIADVDDLDMSLFAFVPPLLLVFYAEEVLRSVIVHPIIRRLLEHPQADRFDAAGV